MYWQYWQYKWKFYFFNSSSITQHDKDNIVSHDTSPFLQGSLFGNTKLLFHCWSPLWTLQKQSIKVQSVIPYICHVTKCFLFSLSCQWSSAYSTHPPPPPLLPVPPPPQPPFFEKASSSFILPLARHHTLISFLIYRLIIGMSLQCPHWAAGGVIEQHKRHLKEGWIIELERGVSGELDEGLLSQVSGCYRVASALALWLTMSTPASFFTSSTLETEQASTIIQ